jgi:hypothetical protein
MARPANQVRFKVLLSLDDNPFPPADDRRTAWNAFSVQVVTGLGRLISSLDEIWSVVDAATYEAWSVRYTELLPPESYDPHEVAYIRDGDQSRWIFGRFDKVASVAIDKFVSGPQDLEYARQIVNALAGGLRATVGDNLEISDRVEAWRNAWMPSKKTLGAFRRFRKRVTSRSTSTGEKNPQTVTDRDSFLRDEIEFSKEPPRFFRDIRQQRLRASTSLRERAAKAFEADPPTTLDQVISRLSPLVVSYSEVLFDEVVKFGEAALGKKATARRLQKLREEALEAVVADSCTSVDCQFLLTVNQLIGLHGEDHRPETCRALWGTRCIWFPFPDDPRCKTFAKRLRARLEIRMDHWEAESTLPPAGKSRGDLLTTPSVEPRKDIAAGKMPSAAKPRSWSIDGGKVRDLRESVSQEAFVRPLGISVDVLQRAEAGKATPKTVKAILKSKAAKFKNLKIESLVKNTPQ